MALHGMRDHPLYSQWKNMRMRSKNRNLSNFLPWDEFPVFVKYCEDNGWEEGLCICRGTLDNPDTGNYGPGNIYFASRSVNTIHGNTLDYIMIDPTGQEVKIHNMAKFCEDNGLSKSAMCSVHNGVYGFKSHKGWRRNEQSGNIRSVYGVDDGVLESSTPSG